MQIRNLYEEFFDANACHRPYASEEEYWQDLLRRLDMLLSAAVLTRVELQRGKCELRMEQIHLRGLPLYVEELVRELQKDTAAEPFPREAVASAVKCADFHISSRLRYTEKTTLFRYRYLARQMHFSEWESFVLLLAFAAGFDAKYETFFSYLQGDIRYKLPSLRLAATLYELGAPLDGETLADAVQGRGELYECFLEYVPTEGQDPFAGMFRLKRRVTAFLYGRNDVAQVLKPFVELYCRTDELEPLLIREEKAALIASYLEQTLRAGTKGNILQLYGPDGIGRRFLVKHAVGGLGGNVLFVDADKLLIGTSTELRQLLEELRLEGILLGAVLVFCGFDAPQGESELEQKRLMPQGISFLAKFLQTECRTAVWITREKADYLLQYRLSVFFMEAEMLSAGERGRLFAAYGGQERFAEDVDLQMCASQYILTPSGIRQVLKVARILAGDAPVEKRHIRDAVGQQAANQLGRSAVRLRSVYTWDDLVVGEEQREQMEMICNQVRLRRIVGEQWGFFKKTAYGRGVCALFYGSPGTGKTMAVQVIANELGLDLYRVDLSQIVSKYIGETQKNISDLFKRAKNTNALLFFDEADALFAKRLTVKDHHDRNANAETAHLLQKLEDYEGLAILATNYAENIDDAFKRRIKFMVNFVFPTPDVRLTLWNTILPPELPLEEELDLEFFAEKFELSGSNIKEILTNAAYLAAAEQRGLKNRDLAKAVRMNFAKYGKTLTDEDFGYLMT